MAGSIDMERISNWINVLLQLKVAAQVQAPLEDPTAVWGDIEGQLDIRPEDFESGQSIINNLELWR